MGNDWFAVVAEISTLLCVERREEIRPSIGWVVDTFPRELRSAET